MSPRARTILISLAVCGLVAAGVYSAFAFTRHVVEVTRVSTGPVVSAFYSTGTISSEREYPVRAQVTGTVKEMRVDKGSVVKKDDILAIVEDPRLAFAVESVEAQLREALAQADEASSPAIQEFDAMLRANVEMADLAQREVERQRRSAELAASSQGDLDRALDRVKQLASERGSMLARRASALLATRRQADVARASLNAARAELEKQNVRAPIDGVVLDRPTPFGTRVDAAMSNHLMTVADVRQQSLVMRAQVDEEDVARVREGQLVKMTLYAFGDAIFDGRVKRIYDKADEQRRTFEVDVVVDPRGQRLLPGMTGELAFIVEERLQARVLPASAVQIRIRPRREGERTQSGDQSSAAAQQAAQADEVREPVIWTVRQGRLHPVAARVGIRSIERIELLPPDPGSSPDAEQIADTDLVVTSPIDPRTAAGTQVRSREATPAKSERLTSSTRPATEQTNVP